MQDLYNLDAAISIFDRILNDEEGLTFAGTRVLLAARRYLVTKFDVLWLAMEENDNLPLPHVTPSWLQ